MTATPKRLLKALDARDGHVCAWDGTDCDLDTLVPQHRGNRQMGGRPNGVNVAGLVWLCSRRNGLAESDPEIARIARARGIKISAHANPAEVPVWMFEQWWLLNTDGTRTLLTPDEAAELRALHGMEA